MTEDFIIPLNGLTRKEFRWHAGKEFFEDFENSEVQDADIQVVASAERSGSKILADCRMDGTLTVPCDRCLEDLKMDVGAEAHLRIRFGEEPSRTDAEGTDGEDGRETVWISPDETELDLRQVVYDYVLLSLPARRVHPDGECNPDAMKYIGRDSEFDGSSKELVGDNPFAALKGLLGGEK